MRAELADKLNRLSQILRDAGSVVVAYSGGVDSSVVMAVAHRVLGDKALACIAASPSYPTREMEDAVSLARQLGARFRIIRTEEYLDPKYASNDADRCYFCKSNLFDQLRAIAQAEGFNAVMDGNNLADLADDRPGMAAARERAVRSPLIEAGITKSEVRELAHALGLPVWDKPAMACLSSRIPRGTPITPELLRQIERAENVLASLGFRQFRVRHHGDLARIELPAADFQRIIDNQANVVEGLRQAGYTYVTLDLAGFRSEPDLQQAYMLVSPNVSTHP